LYFIKIIILFLFIFIKKKATIALTATSNNNDNQIIFYDFVKQNIHIKKNNNTALGVHEKRRQKTLNTISLWKKTLEIKITENIMENTFKKTHANTKLQK